MYYETACIYASKCKWYILCTCMWTSALSSLSGEKRYRKFMYYYPSWYITTHCSTADAGTPTVQRGIWVFESMIASGLHSALSGPLLLPLRACNHVVLTQRRYPVQLLLLLLLLMCPKERHSLLQMDCVNVCLRVHGTQRLQDVERARAAISSQHSCPCKHCF